MSTIGSNIETSLIQAAHVQQTASKARDREKAAATESARRFQDMVELRVSGTETAEAVRRLPQNDSQQAGAEHRSRDQSALAPDEIDQPRIDVQG